MSHPGSRRAPLTAATNLECPLASLGRNSNTVMDSLSGHHQPPYHHPLSSSPLDPQIYQMSRKSPSIDTDDIIYTSNISQSGETINGLMTNIDSNSITSQEQHGLQDIYQLSRNSSHSSLDQSVPTQHNMKNFELRNRYDLHQANDLTVSGTGTAAPADRSSSSHQRVSSLQQRNFSTLEHLFQYEVNRDHCTDGFRLHGNIADAEDSSDAAGGGSNDRRLNRHQGGRCSVPIASSNDLARIAHYRLEKKMDALYLGRTMRGLPIGSDRAHIQNDRFYMEDGLRNVCDYSNNDRISDAGLLHHCSSSPSETSGSDRYILNRTGSPTNVFNSTNCLDNYSNSNNNNASSNLELNQRFHNTKVKSLSDGLCNLGRFSPSLDQGYATLVSPSPTGHSNTISSHSIAHLPPISTMTTVTARRHIECGPPPWNKKGPFRTGPLFDRLPDDVVVKIFNWFDSCELCNVARVCRRFEQLAWRPTLWKTIQLSGEHLSGDKSLKMIFRQLCGQTRNGSCPEVERVMLSDGCRLTDKGLLMLTRRCPELTHLQLHFCVNVSNQILIDVLTKCTNLQHLDVTGCTQINTIRPNPNIDPPRRLLLQYLDLTDCMAIDDVGLKIVVKNCPQLIYLYLRRCIQITDAGLKYVPSFCIALKELSVSDCINITDFGLYELAKLGAALRYLSVAKCDRVSDAGLKVIARRCYKLRYLNTRGCEAVSDDSITVLARSCPRLRALDIGKCDVSDAGLRALAESCPNLKKLSLRNCDMITDRGVQCIAYYCRGLQQLNIQDCPISIEGYRAVKKYCKRCVIEHTNPGFC